MKKLVFSIILLFNILELKSQTKRFVYYFDEVMNPTGKENASIVGIGTKMKIGVRVNFYLSQTNKLFSISDYTDSTLEFVNGENILFYGNGKFQEINKVKMNILDGITLKWDSSGLLTDSILYKNGTLANKTRFEYNFNNILTRRIFTDSINNTMSDIFYDSIGKKASEVIFLGNRGIWKYFDTDGQVLKIDSVFTRESNEANFPGGIQAWRTFLEKNLNPTIPVDNKAPVGTYQVKINMVIDKNGSVTSLTPITKLGYGMEAEVIRTFRKSGKWIPANIYGKPVKSNRIQPVNFQVL